MARGASSPGRLAERRSPMDPQTVIALCAVFMVVLAIAELLKP